MPLFLNILHIQGSEKGAFLLGTIYNLESVRLEMSFTGSIRIVGEQRIV
jgi:hypothetical protein